MAALIDEQRSPNWSESWDLRPDTVYLNHGSFGPPPKVVQRARLEKQRRLDANPMDFFVRELEGELVAVREHVADFVGASAEDLALVDNATYGMNVVAESFPLAAGDEVLLTDHEYGAVRRVWQRQCDRLGAQLSTVTLPTPIESAEQIVESTFGLVSQSRRIVRQAGRWCRPGVVFHRFCRFV